MSVAAALWADAVLAARLLAVDPTGLGGAWLHARPGAVRDAWLEQFRAMLSDGIPWRRLPPYIADERLLGGLDLTATLAQGRPVAERGLLAESDGGVVLLPMAERLPAATAARLAHVLDTGAVQVQRDGLSLRHAARVAVVALDESVEEDVTESQALLDRLPFLIDLESIAPSAVARSEHSADVSDVAQARAACATVRLDDASVQALTAVAAALGVASLRAPILAARVARTLAALAGRQDVGPGDVETAARLVLAPRATRLPEEAPAGDAPPDEARNRSADAHEDGDAERPLDDRVLAAAAAAIPPHLLARLVGKTPRSTARSRGRHGTLRAARGRGRPVGTKIGELRPGARLAVVETLRAAAPWQPLRRRDVVDGRQLIAVRPEDFRIVRIKQPRQTTTVFVVDASGSQALHRLAEAKGAVELLLADCYVRRDRVALIAFRGQRAELVLPPTRSLVRAKRSLAGLPGGGGTPLATGLEAAAELAENLARRGDTPVVVLLTDGRANVARDGSGGRPQADRDAHAAAKRLRAAGHAVLLIDTSPRPEPQAERLAGELGARYVPLPRADAQAVSRAVLAA